MGERFGMVGGLIPPGNAADRIGTHNVYYGKYNIDQANLLANVTAPPAVA
jgi:RPA family protein